MALINNLMLVEDDLDDQEIFKLALEEIDPGLNCKMESSCTHALHTLINDATAPQLIFLDLNLPGINGRECLSQIKRHPQLKDIPVIIYTTSDNYRDKSETKILGATAFITKPSSVEDLVLALRPYVLSNSTL